MVESKKENVTTKKEKEYPVWPGPNDAEEGVVYRSAKSGNLIQLGDTPEYG
jgi:hypothetical protein